MKHQTANQSAPLKTPEVSQTIPEQKTRSLANLGPVGTIVWTAVVFLVAQVLTGFVFVFYGQAKGMDAKQIEAWLTSGSVLAQFFYIAVVAALTFLGLRWVLKKYRAKFSDIGLVRPKWFDIIWAFCGFAAYFLAFAVIVALVSHVVPGLDTEQKQSIGFENVAGNSNLVLTFVSLVIIPPLVEETLFRGFLYTGLRRRLPMIGAMLLTSVIFGAAHLEFGGGHSLVWIAALDTFILSLVLCYLRETTKSLWPSIGLHALKNCLAFLTLFVWKL